MLVNVAVRPAATVAEGALADYVMSITSAGLQLRHVHTAYENIELVTHHIRICQDKPQISL